MTLMSFFSCGQHMISVSPVRAHLTKFHEGVSSPQTESLLHIVGPLSHMHKVRNAGCCRACRRRVCHSACSQARCTEEAMGSWWENPRPQTHTHKKKCGFIASLGQRADGVSLPHGTIISRALSTERNMAWRQRGRGRAKDRHDGAETQSGNTRR